MRFEWDDESEVVLRTEWAAGALTAEIARKLGTSKNSVIGRAHRLKLERRPSPIGRKAAPKPAAPKLPRPAVRRWTQIEIVALAAGLSAVESIKTKWGRSERAIRAKMIELEIIAADGSAVPKHAPVIEAIVPEQATDAASTPTVEVVVQSPVPRRMPFLPGARPTAPPKTCQFPTTADGKHSFLCTEPLVLGRPYCAEHCARCYRRGGQPEDAVPEIQNIGWVRKPARVGRPCRLAHPARRSHAPPSSLAPAPARGPRRRRSW